MDEEALEQRLVPLATQMPWRLGVGALAVGKEIERLGERGLDFAEGLLGCLEVALGLGDLAREPVLLFAEQVDRNRAGVVGVEKLLALGGELGEAAALAGGLLLGLRSHACERVVKLLSHQISFLLWQPHVGVRA